MIKITSKAKNILESIINKEQGKAVFLYLKGGGCNGFSYKFKILKYDIKPNKLDETVFINNYNLYL